MNKTIYGQSKVMGFDSKVINLVLLSVSNICLRPGQCLETVQVRLVLTALLLLTYICSIITHNYTNTITTHKYLLLFSNMACHKKKFISEIFFYDTNP